MRWLVVWAVLAGGCGDDPGVICNCVICRCDEPDAAPSACNPLMQTGCDSGEKCTWVHDTETPTALGHLGCVVDGTSLDSCAYGADGPLGFDNCAKGSVCRAGRCVQICDDSGGLPGCGSGFACVDFRDLFDIAGMNIASVCTRSCDPLTDNDFLGSGTRAGSACGSEEGCYGPDALRAGFVCATAGSPTLVHRTSLAASDSHVLNVCAPGYVPILAADLGDTTLDCVALCAPGNTYAGNPGTQSPIGQLPHRCNTTDARGTFNGDACAYSWRFEAYVFSPTRDTVGFCLDHLRYHYDSNNDGMIDGSDATWPDCTTLPLTGTPNAADFGCVDSTLATPAPTQPLDLQVARFDFD